jgi:hypothetical protein
MRRALATLLVMVFSLPLLAPLFALTPGDAQLPACCRRDGKHHCAMSMEVGNIPARSAVLSETCPYAPFAHMPLLQPHAFALVRRPAAFGVAAGPSAAIGAAEAGYRVSADRARHKRGPPRLLAL